MIPFYILLVEDNKADATLVQRRLQSTQKIRCQIDVADWLNSGLMFARNNEYDIILLDLSLPDSQGVDTVVAMRREKPNTPVIVLSAQEDLTVATKAMEAGADNFLVKRPDITSEELEREILYSMERWRRQFVSRLLMTKSVGLLTLDKREGSVPPPPIAALASAHVNAIEDVVSQLRLFLQRNNPAIGEQIEQMLQSRGFYVAVQELRGLLRMDENIHNRRTQKFSERAMQAIREATSPATSSAPMTNPEAELLEVLGNLDDGGVGPIDE